LDGVRVELANAFVSLRGGERRHREEQKESFHAEYITCERRLVQNCRVRQRSMLLARSTQSGGLKVVTSDSPTDESQSQVTSHSSGRSLMADVQVNAPGGGTPVESGGGSSAAWAIVVIVLLAIVAWFVFGRGMGRSDGSKDININAKVETPAPAPATPTKTP
jgi:hypothetical protein